MPPTNPGAHTKLDAPIADENGETRAAADVRIEYFTDPLCCWSWAFEPVWQAFCEQYAGQLQWRYRMCGLIRDWNSYADPIHSVSRPAQMGPLWYHVRQTMGIELDDRLWIEDPPSSSYPACLACKAAELQSAEAGERYLRAVRAAAMLRRCNIAREETLLEVARQLEASWPDGFVAERFAADFQSQSAAAALREDLMTARYYEIARYPTLLMRRGPKALLLTGYRPLDVLDRAIEQLVCEPSQSNVAEWPSQSPSTST